MRCTSEGASSEPPGPHASYSSSIRARNTGKRLPVTIQPGTRGRASSRSGQQEKSPLHYNLPLPWRSTPVPPLLYLYSVHVRIPSARPSLRASPFRTVPALPLSLPYACLCETALACACFFVPSVGRPALQRPPPRRPHGTDVFSGQWRLFLCAAEDLHWKRGRGGGA
ncbi:hypothetical protein LX32DRAFT_150041 [Colletotrichum zoysiae]|uniref:Uncharacterized protein n=1 Tax=Colletotrichum zoysiae TaxID=1216348 RepID=A0AAD9H8E7_9PEZI|nr:hypothetical protein LX32DRAFT_150041 [Colletotrichum zoysiae]